MVKFSDFLKGIDRGTSVKVNYRGQNSYRTCAGALLSLVLYGIVLIYGVYHTLECINYNNLKVSQFKVFESGDSQISVTDLNG